MWAGTNSGQILVFILTLPSAAKRKDEKVEAMLAKEIQLKHRAPVISIEVIDAGGLPVSDARSPAGAVPHKVLIASEEQFKTFLLPTLKPSGKYKLTAHEGSRIRRIGFTTFAKRSDSNYTENCMTCLTNQGDVSIHGLPDLRRQVQTNCMKKEDMIAISTFSFSPRGEAFFMCSSSELQRVSVTADSKLKLRGSVPIEDGARASDKPAAVTAETSEEQQNKDNESKIAAPKPKPPTSPDMHNETCVSEVSADITLDSVKDHTSQMSRAESSSSTTVTTKVTETKTVTEETKPMTNGNGESSSTSPAAEDETNKSKSNLF